MDNDKKKYPNELFNRPIGSSTNPAIANQLQAFFEKVRAGYPAVEIQTFSFYSREGQAGWADIPKIIFEEIARSAKINNVQLSIHAPEQDFQIAGTPDRELNISKDYKKDSAYKISSVLEAAETMSKIYGQPIKVNMHAGDTTLTIWDKDFEEKVKEKLIYDYNYRKEFIEKLYRMGFITEEQYNILTKNNIDRETLEKNIPSWAFAKSEGIYYRINGDDIFSKFASPFTRGVERAIGEVERGGKIRKEEIKTIVDELYNANENFWLNFFSSIDNQFSNLAIKFRRNIEGFFNYLLTRGGFAAGYPQKIGDFIMYIKSYRNVLDNVKNFVNTIEDNIRNINDEELKREVANKIEYWKSILNENINKIEDYEKKLSELARYAEEEKQYDKIENYLLNETINITNNLKNSFEIVGYLLDNLKNTVFSDRFVPVAYPFQELAIENGAKNIAEGIKMLIEREKIKNPNWYKNIVEYLPDIVIEESYPGAPATRPDIWKELLNKIREELKNIIENYPELKNEIEKKYGNIDNYLKNKIGATLDVGHIKMFEKYGYKKEDILKWVEEIKPEIKHLHVHETQWGSDTHSPLGLGWDDVIAEELEKIKDILGNVSIVHEPGSWYTKGFSQMYGSEYSYYLQGVNPTNVYGPLYGNEAFIISPYGGTQFIPQYIQYTQYSPFSYNIFTQLPLDLGGGKKQQTFTGERID
jgi:hypothetical protein